MSEAENKPEESAGVAVAGNSPASEPNDTISKVHALQQRFYRVCGELYKNAEYVGEPMSDLMLQHYFEQYKREYELMNATEFIAVDKAIEEFKSERDRELEEVKLFRETQKKELEMQRENAIKALELEKAKLAEGLAMQRERELEDLKLMHTELTAEIKRKREKLNNEIDILRNTAELEAQIKISRIIPRSWRRFHIFGWRFGKLRRNEAMIYAEQAANNEIAEYLASRAQEVLQEGDEVGILPGPMTKREYKHWQKQFEKEQRKQRKAKERAELQADEYEEVATEAAETPVQGDEPAPAADVSLIAEND